MEQIVALLFGLSILIFGAINFYQSRIIDRLRTDLKTEREKRSANMQDAVEALQLVLKYQNFLKEKGMTLP